MTELLKSLYTGAVVGFVFAALKLPIPVPTALAGIVGILGIFLGYLLWIKLF